MSETEMSSVIFEPSLPPDCKQIQSPCSQDGKNVKFSPENKLLHKSNPSTPSNLLF